MACSSSHPFLAVLALAASAFATVAEAWSGDDTLITGPVAAELIRVIDGDTILVEAMPWPQQRIEVYVRLRGIDTPELRSSCEKIREAAEAARQALSDMAGTNGTVVLSRIAGDKYFGRIVADVTFPDGRDPARELLLAGYAVSYDGGRKTVPSCDATGS